MTSARNNILACLKTKAISDELKQVEVASHELSNKNDLILRCKNKLENGHASVDIVQSSDEFIASIAQFLDNWSDGLSLAITKAVPPALTALMQANNIHTTCTIAQAQSVITQAAYAIAETGSLLMPSSSLRPTLANFLPENSIIVVDTDDIVLGLEQGFQRVQTSDVGMPRALNLVSGPSKTADIEQTLVYGAHGPKRLHVIMMHNLSKL